MTKGGHPILVMTRCFIVYFWLNQCVCVCLFTTAVMKPSICCSETGKVEWGFGGALRMPVYKWYEEVSPGLALNWCQLFLSYHLCACITFRFYTVCTYLHNASVTFHEYLMKVILKTSLHSLCLFPFFPPLFPSRTYHLDPLSYPL